MTSMLEGEYHTARLCSSFLPGFIRLCVRKRTDDKYRKKMNIRADVEDQVVTKV